VPVPSSDRHPAGDLLLLDFRRRVADLYGELRRRGLDEASWRWWVEARDELFASHPLSPLPPVARHATEGLSYFPYDPALHLGEVAVDPAEPVTFEIDHSAAGRTPTRRFGSVTFPIAGRSCTLSLFWLDVYGGGIFLPFRDLTNGETTYGGGRYLLDTIKAADLGGTATSLVLDFNFAFHPACAHDPLWSCPLAPPENRLGVRIEGGERTRELG
jgi:uncharacterized protein